MLNSLIRMVIKKDFHHARVRMFGLLLYLQTQLENDVHSLKCKIQSLQTDLDNSEAVQRDFVKLSQSLQVNQYSQIYIFLVGNYFFSGQLIQLNVNNNKYKFKKYPRIEFGYHCHTGALITYI